jgi:hypothetical protein
LPALVLLLAALALGAATRTYNLQSPFGQGFDGWLGAMYGQAGRNFDRHGFAEMRFVQHLVSGPLAFGETPPHLHHPPTFPLLVGLSMRAFGVSEASARLVSFAAYIATLLLLFDIVRRLATARLAALATLTMAALPMTGVWGGLVDFPPLTLMAALATYDAYVAYRADPRPRRALLVTALYAFTILVDWPGAFLGLPIALHAWLARPRAPLWLVPVLFVTSIATAAGVLASFEWIRPGSVSEVFGQIRHRTSTVRADMATTTFTAREWFETQALSFSYHFRLPGLVLAALAAPLALWSRREDLRRAAAHAGLLALYGLLTVAVPYQTSFQHAFFGYPLSAAVGLAIAVAVASAWDLAARTTPAIRVALRAAALTAFLPWLFWAQRTTWEALTLDHMNGHLREVGREVAAAVPFEAGILAPEVDLAVWIPVAFYSDRAIELGVDTLAKIEAAQRTPPRPSAPPRFVVIRRAALGRQGRLADALSARHPRHDGTHIIVFDLRAPPCQ